MTIALLPAALACAVMQAPVDVTLAPATVTVRQLTYAQLDGTRNAATLVTPAAASGTPRPAILFLHWYEPPRPTSNRTEFLAEAAAMAGAVPGPKTMTTYEFEHELTNQARLERMAWLREQLKVTKN
jgi:hypothetical protein